MPLRHAKVSSKPDGSDSTLVQPSDWNADHHIPGQQDGDLIYYNGTEWTRLPVGAVNGQTLMAINGAPGWADEPYDWINEAPFLPNPTTSWRSLTPFSGAGTTIAMTAGRCIFIPFGVRRPRALTDLGIEVSTASAGTAEVAIYASDGTATRPSTRLFYVSGLDTGTTGVQSGTVSGTLQPGRYWAAVRCSAAATLHGTANPPAFGISTGGNNRVTHLFNADSALTNPVTTSPTSQGTGTIPHIYARWS